MRCSLAFAITALAAAAVASPIVPISSPIHLLDSEVNKCGSDYCAGTNNTKGNHYLCGDARLGPTKLPTKLPLSSEIYGYDRLGGLCPGEFLKKWYNATGGSYIYPEQNGFQLNTGNAPIDGNQTLAVGARIDRFGSEYGTQLLLGQFGRMLIRGVQEISCRLLVLPITSALSRPPTSMHPPPDPHTRITIMFTRSSRNSTFSVAPLLVSPVDMYLEKYNKLSSIPLSQLGSASRDRERSMRHTLTL